MRTSRPTPSSRRVLVVGARGVVGRAVAEACVRDGIAVTGLGRSEAPDAGIPYRAVDIEDREGCAAALGAMGAFTHVVFAAWKRGADRATEVATNLAMLVNVLDALRQHSPGLRHLTLLQGVKAYGSHLGPFRQRAVETDPRHEGPNFYYAQEDHVRARRAAEGWNWTVLRPVTVCGVSLRSAMSITTVLGIIGSVARAHGRPLNFPGTVAAFEAPRQMVDADLLASAALWAGEAPEAAGEIFNVTNGDTVTWAGLWPRIAQVFGVEAGSPVQTRLSEEMPEQRKLWQSLRRAHGLAGDEFFDAAPWAYADDLFARSYGNRLDTAKLRAAEFGAAIDTREMFERQFRRLADDRLIPPLAPAAADLVHS